MSKENNIFLIGPMGSGKSTIGRQLARKLKKKLYDSDTEIEKKTGVKIALIFDIEGEEGFRQRESDAIDALTQHENIVLATGGGAVLRPENRKFLSERGRVIYLRAPLSRLFVRTRRDKNRPLLQTEDPKEKLRSIVAERDPIYQETADMIIDTMNKSVYQVVLHIIRQIKNHENT